MSCSNCKDVSITCGDVLYAPCVRWEVPSDLQDYIGEDCITLDDGLEDIYTKIKTLEELTDFSEFESDCLSFEETPTLQTVIEAIDAELCSLGDRVEDLENICNILDKDITSCDLDFSCLEELEDECENPISITSLEDLLQVLINKVCELASA